MSTKQPVKLTSVQETLLYPLVSRARETQSGHGVFQDEKAVEMVNKLDYDFSKFKTTPNLYSPILRTCIFDEYVKKFLHEHPNGTIIELGCGLNTRYERLNNGTMKWYDIDFEEVIKIREKFFENTSCYKMISSDVLDTSCWFEMIKKDCDGPWCFVSEAVLIYSPTKLVEKFIKQLVNEFPGCWLVTDTMSDEIVDQHAQDQHVMMKDQPKEGRFKWVCQDALEIERFTNEKLKLVSSKTFLDAPDNLWQFAPWKHRFLKVFPFLANIHFRLYKFNLFRNG